MSGQFSVIRPTAIGGSGLFRRASGGTYTDAHGELINAGFDTPRFDHDKVSLVPLGLLMEPAATNKCTNANANPADLTGTTGATLVADATAISNSGLSNVCTAGNAFHVDNSAGGATVFLVFGGTTGNLNPHSMQVYYRSTGADCTLQMSVSGNGSVAMPAAAEYTWVKSQNVVPSSTLNGMQIAVPAGARLWCVLNQLEEGAACTSVIAGTGGTRAAETSDAMLVSSVPEPYNPDPPIWDSLVSYATDTRVSMTTGIHKVYQRLAPGGIDSSAPNTAPTKWVEVSGTNRWNMFDGANETQTTYLEDIVVVLRPGTRVDNVCLLNLEAATVRVQVAGTDYDETQVLSSRTVEDWYEFFFEPFDTKFDLLFQNLPPVLNPVITITIRNPQSTAACGNCIVGMSKTLGSAEYGATAGIVDYSTKSTSQFGSTTVVARSYSKRMNVSLLVSAVSVDGLQRFLAEYRATPIVWVGAGNLYGALLVYGYYRSFEIVIAYPTYSKCNLEIEGLT